MTTIGLFSIWRGKERLPVRIPRELQSFQPENWCGWNFHWLAIFVETSYKAVKWATYLVCKTGTQPTLLLRVPWSCQSKDQHTYDF